MSKHTKKEMWLISKHGNDVGDNAFTFFKYMVATHPEIRCVYVADKKRKNDWDQARAVGETIQFQSIKHKILFLRAQKIITSHVGDSEPWDYEKIIEIRNKRPRWKQKHKIIHLQHGVIDKNVSHIYDKSLRPVDLFICSTEKEREYIKESLHYSDENVALTGLARFDELYGSEPEKIILLIPRYRREVMMQNPENKGKLKYYFMNSKYYKSYQEILDNARIKELLKKNGYKLYFCPHYEVQSFIGCFHSDCENIVVVNRDKYDLDYLLKKSALMITDYSSVAFDFGYLKRPVIYYQFDKDVFEVEHGGSYFDYERDGFGPVVSKMDELVNTVDEYFNGNLDSESVYENRCVSMFKYMDNKNCERIYNSIQNICLKM